MSTKKAASADIAERIKKAETVSKTAKASAAESKSPSNGHADKTTKPKETKVAPKTQIKKPKVHEFHALGSGLSDITKLNPQQLKELYAMFAKDASLHAAAEKLREAVATVKVSRTGKRTILALPDDVTALLVAHEPLKDLAALGRGFVTQETIQGIIKALKTVLPTTKTEDKIPLFVFNLEEWESSLKDAAGKVKEKKKDPESFSLSKVTSRDFAAVLLQAAFEPENLEDEDDVGKDIDADQSALAKFK